MYIKKFLYVYNCLFDLDCVNRQNNHMKILFTSLFMLLTPFVYKSADAQTDSTLPEPMIGRIEQVHFVTDPIFKTVKIVKDEQGNEDDDLIIVSGGCGYETATTTGFSLKDGSPLSLKVGSKMVKSCQSKYIPIREKFQYFLIIPKKENIDNSWEIGSYSASIFGVYDRGDEWYVSPREIRFGAKFSNEDEKLIAIHTPQGRLNDVIVDISDPIDVVSYNEEYLDELPLDYPPPYFSIKSDTAFLIQAIHINSAFPKALHELIARDDREFKQLGFD